MDKKKEAHQNLILKKLAEINGTGLPSLSELQKFNYPKGHVLYRLRPREYTDKSEFR